MNGELKKLSEARLGKAHQAAKDADILLSAGSYFGAINRSYYAAFYAARALLALKQLDSPKHSGVISLFNLHFVKEGIISKDLGKILNQLFDARSEGDYMDERIFTKQEASDILIMSATFIDGVKRLIDNLSRA
ncbi:HEPN domain-containing protein [Candidatus Saganbacteria bacterium]|nr:HEPN domain-containing protein [Candidatus Saganbacteria bacterium]